MGMAEAIDDDNVLREIKQDKAREQQRIEWRDNLLGMYERRTMELETMLRLAKPWVSHVEVRAEMEKLLNKPMGEYKNGTVPTACDRREERT